MATVHMMVGIPGSGKTTFSKKLQSKYNYPIISTDIVRMNHPNWNEIEVREEVHRLSAEYLSKGADIIYDATNVTPRVRKRFRDEVEKFFTGFEVKAYYFQTDINTCIERVKRRNLLDNELFLPIEVITSYSLQIIEPTCEENISEIIIIKEEGGNNV